MKAWHRHARCKSLSAEGFRGKDGWRKHLIQLYRSQAFEARFARPFAPRPHRNAELIREHARTIRELGGIEPVRLGQGDAPN